MNVYTLDPSNFQKKDVIEDFSSIIWTERYSSAGDIELVLPATPTTVTNIKDGTCIAIDGSKEVMLIDTQSVENGLIKVTGNSLLKFLNERVLRSKSISIFYGFHNYMIYVKPAGQGIAEVVSKVCISDSDVATLQTGGNLNYISNLTLGVFDTTGPNRIILLPYGPLYDVIEAFAKIDNLGLSLYLDYTTDVTYSLKFTTYRGLNRTSDQTDRPVVRFSSALDSLTNIKEFRSNVGYKTAVYVFATEYFQEELPPGVAFAPGTEAFTNFQRRMLFLHDDSITKAIYGTDYAKVNSDLTTIARNVLANNNFTKILDGEVLPQSEFQYGVHYGLGDIIELQGHSDLSQKARITEYIRTQDATGERAYPTVSIID